jgi:hypothetical protein
MRKLISTILPLLLLPFFAKAQLTEAKDELQKIKAYYAGPELKHAAGKMMLKNMGSPKPMDIVNFEYWVMEKQIFSKMNYIEILNNNDVYIMVNHKRKTVYGRLQSELPQKAQAGLFDPEQLAALLSTKGTMATVKKDSSVNKLSLTGLQNSRFISFDISYSSDYKIVAIDAVVRPPEGSSQKTVLEIRYAVNEKKTNAEGPQAVFSDAKYIIKNKKGKYIYTKTYQNYQKL